MHSEKTPLFIGIRAARANLVPGLIVQALMLALLVAYYTVPSVHAWLEMLAGLKQKGGFVSSAVAGALAGGVFPEILTIVVFQHGKVTTDNGKNLMFAMLFWALDGMVVDALYRTQALIFGGGGDFFTIVKKVSLDMGIFTPLVSTPMGMAFYEWKHQDYKSAGLSRVLTLKFYKNKSVPALIACWGVWIPLVTIVYSLPTPLQFPMFSLGLTFWVMLFSYITVMQKKKNTLPISEAVVDASALSS